MPDLLIASLMGLLVLLASIASVELGISVALIEITLGVLAGNILGLHTTPWIDFLAAFGSIVLTFLAGAEVDRDLLREKLKESLLIGGLSFVIPFVLVWFVAYRFLGWEWRAAQIAGVALSTTSLAVVYAVLVETGLTDTALGKLIMASTFVTDFGTAAALSALFIQPTVWIIPFIAVSMGVIVIMVRLQPWFFNRYGSRVIEPEIKGAFAALLVLMFFAERAAAHAVLPVFVLGLAVSHIFAVHRTTQQRFRVVAFALLTPFFFIKAGLNVSLGAVAANLGLLAILFALKMAAKVAGVYPLARRFVPQEAMYTTLLMSTGLTFGTISSLFGLQAGIITRPQFSVLVTTVVLTAVIPTIIAQRWLEPRYLLNGREAALSPRRATSSAPAAGAD
ncbi:MAG: cation:proton antiporter [Armatimonadetes bacterium]|nr:cation:proton antiporter [Armatimonadota bacterium]